MYWNDCNDRSVATEFHRNEKEAKHCLFSIAYLINVWIITKSIRQCHNNVVWFLGFFSVNLAHDAAQRLQGTAIMSEPPLHPAWSADKAVDGNTDQETLTTCAVMDYSKNYKSVWWKVQLGKRFNVAYIEVYFRGSSEYFFFTS